MNIAGIGIGPGQPCRFVAEISNNHNGDLYRAYRLVSAAKEAGADLVKFQAYTPAELVDLRGDGPAPEPWGSQGFTMGMLYEKAQTPLDWFPLLDLHCKAVGIPWFSSVFGAESLALLESLDCPAYKIAALDNQHRHLIDAAKATGKTVLVSVRGQWLDDGECRYLACPPGYPARAEDVCLPTFAERLIGLSSHCLDPLLPVAAVARGAKLLEYHFQLDDEPSELEANVSLTASQFRRMVDDVRRTEVLLGENL